MKENEVWDKIFPLRLGEKVVIKVTNPRWSDFAKAVNGKEGKIIGVRGEGSQVVPSKYPFLVLLEGHTYGFQKEELKRVD